MRMTRFTRSASFPSIREDDGAAVLGQVERGLPGAVTGPP